jgi:hypothetical protein
MAASWLLVKVQMVDIATGRMHNFRPWRFTADLSRARFFHPGTGDSL